MFADKSQDRPYKSFGDQGLQPLDLLNIVAVTTPVLVDVRDYPMISAMTDSAKRRGDIRLSPAAALYVAHCMSIGKMTPALCSTVVGPRKLPGGTAAPALSNLNDQDWPRQPLENWTAAISRTIAVTWGQGIASGDPGDFDYRKLVQAVHGAAPNPGCPARRDLLTQLHELIAAFASGLNRGPVGYCVYHHDLAYEDLQSDAIGVQDIKSFLNKKIIFIGGSFKGGNDFVQVFHENSVPGLYYHAMALDNLLSFGAIDYPKSPQEVIANTGIKTKLLFLTTATFLMSIISNFVIVTLNSIIFRRTRDIDRTKITVQNSIVAITFSTAVFSVFLLSIYYFFPIDNGIIAPFDTMGGYLVAVVMLIEIVSDYVLIIIKRIAPNFFVFSEDIEDLKWRDPGEQK